MRLGRVQLPALAVLVTLLLFVLLEVSLRVLGVGGQEPIPWTLNPQAAYLVPVAEQPGAFVTQFEQTAPERVVPPKGAATRVCVFGGSVAASFREAPLLSGLNGPAASAEEFEVVNLGRGSYGSERTRIILSQALQLLDPDIAVINTGDIEFSELGSSLSDSALGRPVWVESLPGFLAETNLCGLLIRLATGSVGRPGEKPEPLRRDPSRYEMTYDQTLAQYELLRGNLRAMCQGALARGTQVVLCTPIYNHFTAPFGSEYSPGLARNKINHCERLLGRVRELLPPFLDHLIATESAERIVLNDWLSGAGERSGPIPGRRPCTGPLAALELGAGDPADWSARLWELHEDLETLHARDFDDAVRADLEEAEELLGKVLERAPDHAVALHQLALVEYLLERDEDLVVEHFELAAEYDRCPSRGNRLISRIVREVAAEFPEVLLFDSEALFRSYVPLGLVGFEWMKDHAHIHPVAREVLMGMLAEAILARWAVLPDGDSSP